MCLRKRASFSSKLTTLDIKILSFLSVWRCCDTSHLCQALGVSMGVLRHRLKALEGEKWVAVERLFVERPATVRLTAPGAKQMGVKPSRALMLSDYFHEMAIIDVALGFEQKHPEALWISSRGDYSLLKGDGVSSRQVLKGWDRDPLTQRFQIPDGYLFFPNNRCMAIEVELTLKNKRRREEIFKNYAIALDIDEVWYVCSPEVERVLLRESEGYPFVKVSSFVEILAWRTGEKGLFKEGKISG